MPRVPQYNIGQTQVANLPSARLQNFATADVLDPGISRGLQQAAGVANQIAQQEREKQNTARLMEADRRLSEWETQRLYAPEQGLLNRRGKDALGIINEAEPEFDNLVGEIERGLGDEALQMKFRQLANGRRTDVQRQLYRHVSAQSDTILESERQAYQAAGLASIAAHWSDPERVAMEKDRMWAAQLTSLQRQGAPAEVIRASRQALDQSATSTVLDQILASGQAQQAREFYEANRDVLGERADEYGKQVRAAGVLAESQSAADSLIAQYGTGRSALVEARKIEDPEVRDRVEARIEREDARRTRERNEWEQSVAEGAWTKINNGGGVDGLTPQEFSVLAAKPGVLSAMESRARQVAEGVEPVRDDARWYSLLDQASTDPQAFVKLDLNEERPRMDNAGWNQLVQLQAQMKRPAGSHAQDSELLSGYRTTKQVVDDTLRGVGIPTSPKPGTSEAEELASFRRALDEQVISYQQQTGKKPATVDIQKMTDTLLIEGKIQGRGWFGTFGSGRLFEASPDEVFIPDEVPEAEREKIATALQRNGVANPTEAQILDLYTAKLRRTR